MARKIEKGGKFRNDHCRTWNMEATVARKTHEKPQTNHADQGLSRVSEELGSATQAWKQLVTERDVGLTRITAV